MIRNLKTLGLAVAAAFAITAAASSAAQAEELFHSDLSFTVLTGSQSTQNVLTTSAGTIKCTKTTVEGTVLSAKTFTELQLEPTFGGCTAFGFINATVQMNGCAYDLTSDGTAKLHIVCFASDITITAFTCVMHIPAQTPTTSVVDYVNGTSGGKGDITLFWTISGLKYTTTSGCPGGANEKDDGTLTGSITLTGESSGGVATNISWG